MVSVVNPDSFGFSLSFFGFSLGFLRLGIGFLRLGIGLTNSRFKREKPDNGSQQTTAQYQVEYIAELHNVIHY